MRSTPSRPRAARRALGGAVAAALAAILAGCATGTTTPTTGLGTVDATPTLAVSAGTGGNGDNGGATSGPGTSPSVNGVPSSPSGGHPTVVPPPPSHVFPTLTNEDCIGFNPATVSIIDDGATGYQITDGSSIMLLLDNMADANVALALVRNYNQQCFIGRDNTRTGNDRYRHIVQYWKGTGVPGSSVPTPDCIGYDNTSVAAHNIGADGWQVTAGAEALVLVDSQADANNAVALAHLNHHMCFIGRGNSRPLRAEYIVEYWTS